MTGRPPDVIVIGGGIVGTAAAAFLVDAGASVVLVEREGLASGASGANSGVVQHPFDPILAALYRETVGLYRRLSDAGAGFHLAAGPAGMLFVSTGASPVRRLAASLAADFPGLPVEIVSGGALETLEPTLAPGLWACRVGIGYPVIPAASTYAYATLAERGGAEVRLGRAASLAVEGDRVVGVRIEDQLVSSGAVLIAAGPWSPELLDPSRRWVPIQPRWGVVVEAALAATPRHVLEEAGIDAAIGTPPSGSAAAEAAADMEPADDAGASAEVEFSLVPQAVASAVGSTFLAIEPDPAAWIERVLVNATRFVPGVAEAPIHGVRACARPQSVDGRPLVGAVPGRRGLFVCAGHGPWGISTGPASARLVVDAILGRDPSIPPELSAGRLEWREGA